MEETMTGPGLMSLCTDAFNPSTTDHTWPEEGVKGSTLVNLQTVHVVLVVTAADWVPQTHTFKSSLTQHQTPLPNISLQVCCCVDESKQWIFYHQDVWACKSYVQDSGNFNSVSVTASHVRAFHKRILLLGHKLMFLQVFVIWLRPTKFKVWENRHSC